MFTVKKVWKKSSEFKIAYNNVGRLCYKKKLWNQIPTSVKYIPIAKEMYLKISKELVMWNNVPCDWHIIILHY